MELVTLLNNAGLFKTALEICAKFSMPYTSVFEVLTKQCVLLSEQEDPNAWNWLIENDLQGNEQYDNLFCVETCHSILFLDLPVNRENVSDVSWKLLQDYLNKYEEPSMSSLHYVVCKKIINMNIYIPFWLLTSYKVIF